MQKFQWAAFVAQAANLAALAASMSSPHTAAVIGGSLTILQAVFPSVFHTVNTSAVASNVPSGTTTTIAGTK